MKNKVKENEYRLLWPPEYKAFYEEYRQLCRKYKLMVLSEGEKVTIAEYDKELWWLKYHTKHERKRRREHSY